MRILFHLSRQSPARLVQAALGLVRRGHDARWLGHAPKTDAPVRLIGWHRVWADDVDVVVADSRAVLGAALAGRLARARCLIVGLEHELVAPWNGIRYFAWQTSDGWGLIEPDEADVFRNFPLGVYRDRLALWSDDPPPDHPDASHTDVEILERACERALARHRGRAPRPAVFVDRDGTLVREVGYLADPADLELLPGAAEALRELAAAGYAIIVVSNQSGVGRGFFPATRVYEAMNRLRELLRERGVELDAIYFCPHRPEAGCACRKPRPGLLERAAEDQVLRLGRSAMVGDKLLDAATGHAAGARGILVRTGYGRDEEQRIGAEPAPDRVCDDLPAAARWILAQDAEPG